jgi:coenzyme PQQ precursor peptide PqqA
MKIIRPDPGFSRYKTRGPAPILEAEIPGSGQGGFAMWTKPQFTEMRFGFEVTLYIANR